MNAELLLAAAAAGLGLAAARELAGMAAERTQGPTARLLGGGGREWARSLAAAAVRIGLRDRISRAGLGDRLPLPAAMAAKAGGAVAGTALATIAAPAAPGRTWPVVAIGLPLAGFLSLDAALERLARRRLREIVAQLPDALDLLAVGVGAGRGAEAVIGELAAGEGSLASELAAIAADLSSGSSLSTAFDELRRRVPGGEVASLVALVERSRRHGSPLADQLRDQAAGLRADHRRRVEEDAARAAPKIQLAVALLLVPSVLLMIAAALIANSDLLLAV